MRRVSLSVLAIVCLLVRGGFGCKSQSAEAGTGTTAQREVANSSAKIATVVMVANMGEADESCGCGDIIRSVRSAAAKGVRTREVDTRNKSDLIAATQKYRIVVQPSVVMVDDADHEVRRFEGESKDTTTALQTELERLVKK